MGEPLRPNQVLPVLRKGKSARVDAPVDPKFRPGDAVRVRNLHPYGHTRAPRYVRGRRGVVDRDHGVFVFPDTHAASGDPAPQHCYSVRFESAELWGEAVCGREAVYVDLWDTYLEPA